MPVRYDPFDMGTAYAYVDGQWVRCISEHYALLQGRSEREVRYASLELRRQKQQYANHITTVESVIESITDGVTKEHLIAEAHEIRKKWKERHASDSSTT